MGNNKKKQDNIYGVFKDSYLTIEIDMDENIPEDINSKKSSEDKSCKDFVEKLKQKYHMIHPNSTITREEIDTFLREYSRS